MMLRTALAILFLAATPSFSLAQDHHKAHEQFVQRLIDQRVSLKLTSTQVTKLKSFKAKMVTHHKDMSEHGEHAEHAKHEGGESSMDDAMHKELLSIFAPAQRPKIDAMLKEHMKKCGVSAVPVCKLETGLK
ncbi:MAG TPA: hypothetical protein VM100_13800 [Longimicrobiales bacterium]|nr:hypothetical protein [Longimicrobiales bacterium]